MRRFLAGSIGSLVLVALVAMPAGAHAQLLDTDPQVSEALDESPPAVTLSYTEAVEASVGAVRVYDGDAERIDVSPPEHPGGDVSEVRVDLPDLADGSYVVTWRVISADSHPVQGAFTFQVGTDATATAGVEGLAEELLAEQGGDTVVGVVYGIDRFIVFASIALLLGGIGFVVLLAPSIRGTRRTRRLLWGSWLTCVVATLAGIGLQGAHGAGLGLVDALRPSTVEEVLNTQFGQVSVVRVLLLVMLALLMRRLLPRVPVSEAPIAAWWFPVTTLTVVAIAATPGFAGHATTGDHIAFALVADTLHVLAMALWIGGLVFLVVAFLPGRDAARAQESVTRFSRLALACVSVLVLTGAFQSWRQVGSLDALRDTDYGQLLIIKVVLVAMMVVVAAFSREIVFRLYAKESSDVTAMAPVPSGGALDVDDADADEPIDDARELRRLRRSVAVEVGFAVAVLAVTAMLVNTPPARAEVDAPFTTTVEVDDLRFDVRMVPGNAGPNDLHLDVLTPAGAPTDPLEIEATIEYPAEEIAPIDLPVRELGPGHVFAPGFDLPIAGEWMLEVRVLVTEVEEVTAEVPVSIR